MAVRTLDILSTLPPPDFSPVDLQVVRRAAHSAANRLLERPLFSGPSWAESWDNLDQQFGLDRQNHCFRENASEWVNYLEPQITRGFAHFLSSGTFEIRAHRCMAFYRAACRMSDVGSPVEPIFRPNAVVAKAEEKRIDLLVEIRGQNRTFGVAVEAKFKHKLTKRQLKNARWHTRKKRGWSKKRSSYLLIVSRKRSENTAHLLENPRWKEVTWWDFMLAYEHELAREYDDPRFSQFRKDVWCRAYIEG